MWRHVLGERLSLRVPTFQGARRHGKDTEMQEKRTIRLPVLLDPRNNVTEKQPATFTDICHVT